MTTLSVISAVAHPANWYFGWGLILSGFLVGAAIGLFFHRDEFWGGYSSFRRRLVRLGHVAQAALGMINILFALSPWPGAESWNCGPASICFIVGGTAMPVVCFLSAWKKPFRHLFFIPVTALLAAVTLVLIGGPS